MKQTRPSMACAGSLTPELEGASRSAAHPKRQAGKAAASAGEQRGAKKI